MIYLYTSKFDIEEEQSAFLKEFFSRDKIKATREEREITPNRVSVDPISDTKEEGNQEEEQDIGEVQIVIDDKPDLPLPPTKVGSTQLRASIRARKRIRRDNDQYTYYQLDNKLYLSI